jgi:hypothetical protein
MAAPNKAVLTKYFTWLGKAHPDLFFAYQKKINELAAREKHLSLGAADFNSQMLFTESPANPAPVSAPAAGSSPAWLTAISSLANTFVTTANQRAVFDENLRRLKAGQPPLGTSPYSPAQPNVQLLLVGGAVLVGGFFLLSGSRGRR